MLWEASHAPVEKKLLLQFVKNFRRSRKVPIPKQLAAGPQLGPGLAIFYTAFWDLVTERASPDSPIPWSRIRLWAEKHRLGDDASEILEHHVRAMDLAFLKWKGQNSKRKSVADERPQQHGKLGSVRQ